MRRVVAESESYVRGRCSKWMACRTRVASTPCTGFRRQCVHRNRARLSGETRLSMGECECNVTAASHLARNTGVVGARQSSIESLVVSKRCRRNAMSRFWTPSGPLGDCAAGTVAVERDRHCDSDYSPSARVQTLRRGFKCFRDFV